jgi:hypothetical protein
MVLGAVSYVKTTTAREEKGRIVCRERKAKEENK